MSKLDELYDRVSEKLAREAAETPQMDQIVDYLKERAKGHVDNCMALLDEKKTLAGAYQVMEKAAREQWEKNRQARCVCFGQAEACAIIDAYYGLTAAPADSPTPAEKKSGKVVSLFEML